MNYKLVRRYKTIDQIYIYNKEAFFLKNFFLFKKIVSNKFYASFAVDGKSFSNLCNFFIKAKYKLGLVYNYKFFLFWFSKPNFLYNFLIFDKFENFTSKKYLKKIEHLPQRLSNLANFFNLNVKTSDKYNFKTDIKDDKRFKNFYKKKIRGSYVLIHLDEKWNDIQSITNELYLNLINLQSKIKKKIVITSYNNNFQYFINLKRDISKFRKNKNILLINNSNLFFFERLINYSFCSISCHSGFLVQIAGSSSTKIIDIINKSDFNWYSSWKPKNTVHEIVFKSNKQNHLSINKIFVDLKTKIQSF